MICTQNHHKPSIGSFCHFVQAHRERSRVLMLGDPPMISRFVCAVNMITPQFPCNLRLNDRAHRKTDSVRCFATSITGRPRENGDVGKRTRRELLSWNDLPPRIDRASYAVGCRVLEGIVRHAGTKKVDMDIHVYSLLCFRSDADFSLPVCHWQPTPALGMRFAGITTRFILGMIGLTSWSLYVFVIVNPVLGSPVTVEV